MSNVMRGKAPGLVLGAAIAVFALAAAAQPAGCAAQAVDGSTTGNITARYTCEHDGKPAYCLDTKGDGTLYVTKSVFDATRVGDYWNEDLGQVVHQGSENGGVIHDPDPG